MVAVPRRRASGIRAAPPLPSPRPSPLATPGLRPVGAARAGPRPGAACPGGGPRDAAAPPAAARFRPPPRVAAAPRRCSPGARGWVASGSRRAEGRGRGRDVAREEEGGVGAGSSRGAAGEGVAGRRSGATAATRRRPAARPPAGRRPRPPSPLAARRPRPGCPLRLRGSPALRGPAGPLAAAAGSCSLARGPPPGGPRRLSSLALSPGLAATPARACARAPSETRPQIRRGDPLNLSILVSGGKETNQDSLSNGE